LVRRSVTAPIEDEADREMPGEVRDGCEAVDLTDDFNPDIVVPTSLWPGSTA
jgi:hypothetical protein